MSEARGPHGSEGARYYLLGYDTVWSCRFKTNDGGNYQKTALRH